MTGPGGPGGEVSLSHSAVVGRTRVRRAFPNRTRRTIGAWCFADHIGPMTVTEDRSIDIGPHPHIGLQTVTWLTRGELLHRDSLGSEQVVRAGELNLMTAGAGISHSEEATGRYRGPFHGAQLWVAQPETTRGGSPAFEHLVGLPTVALGEGRATVMVGSLAGVRSPARADTDHFGADVALPHGRVVVPLATLHEHGVIVLDGAVDIDGGALSVTVGPGTLTWLAPGQGELALTAREPTRLLLLGGTPWAQPPLMWWNFVARTGSEMASARDDWERGAPRFGRVDSPLGRIAAPPLPHLRIPGHD